MVRFVFATLMLAILSTLPSAGNAVENGTRVIVSDHSYWALITRLEAAIKRQKLQIISRASVRGAERQRKLGIPGNMVIGAFRDEYAARILRANVAAGIEAPIRFYITRGENDKTTTLWYRRPSWVLAPYGDESGDLRALATELDSVMDKIVAEATKQPGPTRRLLVKRNTGKRKAARPTPDKPAARKAERVAKATPAKPAKTAKATLPRQTDRTPAGPVKATLAKPAQRQPSKTVAATTQRRPAPLAGPAPAPIARAAPKPLAGAKSKPLAGAAPKPLTRAEAAPPRLVEAAPQQRAAKASAPEQTSRRATVKPAAIRTAKPKPDRVTEHRSIELSPLMLRLQGQ